VARRPLEREEVYFDGGRRTTQLMRDPLDGPPLRGLMSRLPLTLAAAAFLYPSTGVAQQNVVDSTTIQATMATLRSDLRNFVTAQEQYFVDHVTYARSLQQLQSYRPSPGVTVVLLTASDSGHSEIAISENAPDLVCAMFIGNVPKPFGTGQEGAPTCHAR
jgi:hypothetical protein